MQHALALLTWIVLTQLDGTQVWIETNHLQIIKDKSGCDHRSGSTIRVGGASFCVKETAEEITDKIRDAK